MSRRLPPRPDFTQLRHQGKDLLRAHGQKDQSACGVLKRLRRFATVDDAAILGAQLTLHEAQYALAMEYGFASWNALKRYVEKVTGRPTQVRREKDRTYVTGLEEHPIGSDGKHESSWIAALAGVMSATGEDFSYEYLMGASGAAFRVQMGEPTWCPSAACTPCGYDCLPGAVAATGYRLTSIHTQRDGKWLPDGIRQARQAITESIDRGIPVMLIGIEAGLIVGYDADGKLVLRSYPRNDEGYSDEEVFGALDDAASPTADLKAKNDWAWEVGVIEPQDVPMPRRDVAVNSLQLAVKLAKTERFDKYLSGFAALQYWAEGLLDEPRYAKLTKDNWFPTAHANGYCYGCFWSARMAAEQHLRETAGDLGQQVRPEILEIADTYKKVHETLGRKRPEYACPWSLMPWHIGDLSKWTPEMRRAESEALREAMALEHQAIAKIEDVLASLQQPVHA